MQVAQIRVLGALQYSGLATYNTTVISIATIVVIDHTGLIFGYNKKYFDSTAALISSRVEQSASEIVVS